jgi:hypothetical protein
LNLVKNADGSLRYIQYTTGASSWTFHFLFRKNRIENVNIKYNERIENFFIKKDYVIADTAYQFWYSWSFEKNVNADLTDYNLHDSTLQLGAWLLVNTELYIFPDLLNSIITIYRFSNDFSLQISTVISDRITVNVSMSQLRCVQRMANSHSLVLWTRVSKVKVHLTEPKSVNAIKIIQMHLGDFHHQNKYKNN